MSEQLGAAARSIGLHTWWGLGLGVWSAMPSVGLIAAAAQKAHLAGWMNPGAAMALDWTGLVVGGPLLWAGYKEWRKGRSQAKKKTGKKAKGKSPTFNVGDMTFTDKDLHTNLLVTGTIGSGKTSAILLPLLEQLLMTYREECDDPLKTPPLAKVGGLMVDVKGQFYEYVIALMYRAGRNVVDDLIVLTPMSDFAVVEMVEPETGHRFFLPARNCSSGSEAGLLLGQHRMPDGDRFPIDLFEYSERERAPYEAMLKDLMFRVEDDTRFIGWRDAGGGQLWRCSHMESANRPSYIVDDRGKPITVQRPKHLKYVRVIWVNNQVRTNLLNPLLPSAEVANRAAVIAQMASGNTGGAGENQYFYDQASIVLGMTIELWRELYPDKEVTVVDVLRMVTQQSYLASQLKLLRQEITKVTAAVQGKPEHLVQMEQRRLTKLVDIGKYFEDNWGQRDARNKGLIASTVETAFKAFLGDSNLQEVFCRPSTFQWTDVVQEGKIIVLHAGPKYESLGKQLGTGAKFDFQSAVLSRLQLAHLNKSRMVIYIADEGHNFATAGGAQGGDDRFMSLAREACCCNVVATQSLSSLYAVIGEKNANVYNQCFGGLVALHTMDQRTAKHMSELIGQIRRERSERSGADLTIEGMLGWSKKGGDINTSTKQEKEAWFSPDFFHSLDTFESVVFNKGQRGRYDKIRRAKNKPTWLTGPQGKVVVAESMRRYFQEAIEMFLHRAGHTSWVDHRAPEENPPPAAPNPEPKEATPPQAVEPVREKPPVRPPGRPVEPPVAEPPSLTGEAPPLPRASVVPLPVPGPVPVPPPVGVIPARPGGTEVGGLSDREVLGMKEAPITPDRLAAILVDGLVSRLGNGAEDVVTADAFLHTAMERHRAEEAMEHHDGYAGRGHVSVGPGGVAQGMWTEEDRDDDDMGDAEEVKAQANQVRQIRAEARRQDSLADMDTEGDQAGLSAENMAKLNQFRERFRQRQGGA